jgi:hypothetical protein
MRLRHGFPLPGLIAKGYATLAKNDVFYVWPVSTCLLCSSGIVCVVCPAARIATSKNKGCGTRTKMGNAHSKHCRLNQHHHTSAWLTTKKTHLEMHAFIDTLTHI